MNDAALNPGPREGGPGDNSAAFGMTIVSGETQQQTEERIRAELARTHKELTDRGAYLRGKAKAMAVPVPEEYVNDASDLLKSLKKHIPANEAEMAREKKPFNIVLSVINSFFKKEVDDTEEVVKSFGRSLKTTQDKIALRRQAEAEAEAKAVREEQERKQREIEVKLAEEKRKADEAEAERKRIAAEQQAELDRLERERVAREAKAKAEKEEGERKIREAEAAKQKALEDEAASARARKKAIDKANADQLEAERALRDAEAKRIADEAKAAEEATARAKKLQADQEEADRVAARAQKGLASATTKSVQQGQRVASATAKEEKITNASASDFSHIRGDHGSLATQREKWICTEFNRADVDLETLRAFFREDDIAFAIRQYIKTQDEPTLRGATIVKDTQLVSR